VVNAIRALGGGALYDHEATDMVTPDGIANAEEHWWTDLFHSIRIVSLEGDVVTDDNFPDLGQLDELVSVGLIGTRISGRTLRLLSTTRIETIEIKGGSVVDDDLVWLARIPSLTHIYLSRVAVTDAGVRHLCTLRRLKAVGLQNTRVTPAGAARLEACTGAKVFLE